MALKQLAFPRRVGAVSGIRAALASCEAPAALLVTVTVFTIIQRGTPSIIGIDGYYHVKLAAILREQGWRMLLPLDFPWLQLTILNPAQFTDHHLLYHLLLVPFTAADLRIGAKLAAVIFGSAALVFAYHLMAQHRVRYPLVWLLVLLASASPFLTRLSMTRRQSVTLLLLLLALHLIFTRRSRWLVPLGFAFSWLYDGFPLLMGVCGAAFIGSWWERRRADWSLLLYPGLGVGLGTLMNPYFPNNAEFSYQHMMPKMLQILGMTHADDAVRVGAEWYPPTWQYLSRSSWLAVALVLVGFVPILLDPRPIRLRALDGKVVALALLAVVFLAMYLRARRWIEYEPAFATLFCAVSWARALPNQAAQRLRGVLTPGREPLVAVAATALVAPLLYSTVSAAALNASPARGHTEYRDAALWLSENTPHRARVFATDWDDFPHLFYWNTHNVYLAGLDPTYMYLHDRPAFLTWRAIARGEVERPSALIRDQFDSGYVFTDLRHTPFLRQAGVDPDLIEVFRDSNAPVFVVNGWREGSRS